MLFFTFVIHRLIRALRNILTFVFLKGHFVFTLDDAYLQCCSIERSISVNL